MHLRLRALLFLSLLTFSTSAQQYLEMMDAGTYTVAEIQQAAEAYFDVVGRGRGSGYKQFKRWEYVALREMNATGVKISNFDLATQAREHRRAEKLHQNLFNAYGGDWKELGPTYWNATSSWNPGVGHITSIGIDVSNTNHIIVGSPTGGVWKTLNAGDTWTPLTDEFSTVDVYTLEISPYNNNHYLWGSTSGKIFTSTDAGATWTATGNLTGGGKVLRIQFHPTDPTVVYAVSESSGLFRSTNSGSTWTAVTGVSGMSGYDVEFKPGDPNTIYFSGSNVFRSTNGGASFTQINGFGTANNNYKMMGVSPANPSFVYILEANGGRFGAFYKSTDSGASYTKLIDGSDINFFGYSEIGDDDRGQAPRNMDVAVNPFDADIVHIAGIHTWRSVNGGISFDLTSYWVPGTAASLGVGYNHADVDILKFVDNTLYVGTDGGMYTSFDEATSFQDRTTGLGIREFYKIGVSKTNPNVVSGGSQDNGTSVMRGPNRQWVDWLGADGMESFVDWSNDNNLFGTSQYGSMYGSNDQGSSAYDISKPEEDVDGSWITPFEQDPQVPTTVYVAFADVWKSTDSGSSWTKISDFANGNMNEMKIAPSDNQRIYVSRGSALFTTANGGGAWVTTAKAWGGTTINYIAIHPENPQRLLIVTSGGVYHSTDAGNTWANISAGLPSGSKYCAAWENTGKNGIYVGSFGSVSYTNDDLPGQWIGFMDGLPNVRVYELEINYISNTIFAGTYGRGLWESPIYQALPPVAAFNADKRLGCRELTVNFTDQSSFNPTAWEWTFEGGSPATSNLKNPTVTFSGSGTFTVQLKTSNHSGENTFEATDFITVAGPSVPAVTDVERCGPGAITLEATAMPGEELRWYTSLADPTPLFTGATFTTNITQTTTFYTAASTGYLQTQHVGPVSRDIGGGSNHAGNFFLVMDAQRPFLLKSATVYATGDGNRTFQLRDVNGVVLIEKTIFVTDGESRILLDMDIPVGADMQLGCLTPANLFRSNSGVTYPYSISGLVQIKSSTAGLGYYYYLYDLELESTEGCESDRVPVTGNVSIAPVAPVVTAAGATALCPGETVVLTADNVCPDCTVQWSTGETGPSITVATGGTYTATVINPLSLICGNSPASNAVVVTTGVLPVVATLAASGSTTFCPGQSVVLTADNVCPDCTVLWSTGETGPSITVGTAGDYTASTTNFCGTAAASDTISVNILMAPASPEIAASGPTVFCPGGSVVLTADNICAGCTVEWSTGETGPSITVAISGAYTALVHDPSNSVCGNSLASNAIEVTVNAVPDAPAIVPDGATVLCPGEIVALSIENICPGCTVQWSTGETGPSIAVATPGAYTATLSNTCGTGAVSNTIFLTLGTLPDLPVVAISGDTVLCPGETITLTAGNVCPGCLVSWSTGDSTSNIQVATSGIYTVGVSNGCGASLSSVEVELINLPPFVPPVLVSDVCHLTAPWGSDFQWFLNGVAIPGATGPTWTAQVTGLYSLSMNSSAGCSGTSAPVQVDACVSNTSNPEGVAYARVYPNPAKDRIYLELQMVQASGVTLDLFAADGRFVATLVQGEVVAGGNVLDIVLPDIPAGMYRYRLALETGSVYGNLAVQR